MSAGESTTAASDGSGIQARTFEPNTDWIQRTTGIMTSEITAQGRFAGTPGDTPAIDLVPAAGTGLKALTNQISIGNDLNFEGPCRYKVTAPPKDGILDVTLLCPVSGHCGLELANAWAGLDPARLAETNHFYIRVTLPDGTSHQLRGRATGYVTPVPLSIPLRGGQTRIEYWPEGSGGVGGFASGRTITIDYSGAAERKGREHE